MYTYLYLVTLVERSTQYSDSKQPNIDIVWFINYHIYHK
jgi:hypothetical protein